MTKMKSKKMTKSTFAIIIMAVAMVAMLAFGGTYAYFTATAYSHSSEVKTGVIHLVTGEAIEISVNNAVTGTEVFGEVSYDLTDTTVKSYVFVTVTTEVEGSTLSNLCGVKNGETNTGLPINETNWTYSTDLSDADNSVYVFYMIYEPTEDGDVEFAFCEGLTITASPNWTEGDTKPAEMGATITISMEAKAVQYENITGVDEAAKLAEAYNA